MGESGWLGLETLETRTLFSIAFAITDLGTLGGPASWAASLNQQQVVVGRSLSGESPATTSAFRWDQADGMQALGVPPGYLRSEATSINAFGEIVGTALNADMQRRALLWRDDVVLDLGGLGGLWSEANAINSAGEVVGTAALPPSQQSPGDNFHAFLWDQDAITNLGTLGGRSAAKDINDSGLVAGLSYPSEGRAFDAVAWQNGVITDLGTLGGPASAANAVNEQGQIVGNADLKKKDENGFYRHHAALWEDGQTVDLGTLGGKFSSAAEINDLGQVVGWSETKRKDALGQRVEHAFLFHAGKMHDLNDLIDDPAWTLTRATAISNEGFIAGYGTLDGQEHSSLDKHAFLLRPLYADLTIGFGRLQVPDMVVPGDRIRAEFVLTNQGETDASGKIAIELFARDDETGQDFFITRLADRRLKLAPGQSKSTRITMIVPGPIAPGQYRIVAAIVATPGIEEDDASNNSATSETVHQVVWKFGRFDDRRAVKLSVADGLGHVLTFSIRGGGFGEVLTAPGGMDVMIHDTNDRSSLAITGDLDDDLAAVHNVTINGSLRALNARRIDLSGHLSATAAIGRLVFDDAAAQSMVTIGPGETRIGSVRMTFDQIADSRISTEVPIMSFTASNWQNMDEEPDFIDAPALFRLRIKGNRKAHIAGDFNADLSLSGRTVGSQQLTLGTVRVSGRVNGGRWEVAGHAGAVEAESIDQSWQASILGRVGRLRVKQNMSGKFSAEALAILTVGGDLHDAQLDFGPATSRRDVLGTVRVGGRMRHVTVRASGNIGAISIGAAQQVNLLAGIREDATGLPEGVFDFQALASISKLVIAGLRNEPSSVIDMNVAAWSIGSIKVSRAASAAASLPGAKTLSIAAHDIRAITYRTRDGTLRLRRPDDFFAPTGNNLVVRIV